MSKKQLKHSASSGDDGLVFIPLGGAGEIGMNLNLYGYNDRWLMVDLGVSFHDGLGIDVMMPNISFIEKYRDNLEGIVITHAHEDHVGAVPYLWPYLKCPVYATPFTAEVLRRKLKEVGLTNKVKIVEVPLGKKVDIGPFEVDFITMTHSIPEPNALAINTPLGTVIHTGDWKIDADPVIGKLTDVSKFDYYRKKGVLALVCDSTNVFSEGSSGSESLVRTGLIDLIAQQTDRRVVVSCFASNVARIATCIEGAEHAHRTLCLAGKSMHRMVDIATQTAHLKDLPPITSEDNFRGIPRRKSFVLCTGSQGEPRAALNRIAHKTHPHIQLDPGDVVILSSRIIPGNETKINTMCNAFARQGVEVITHHESFIHVSGHPSRDELAQLYEWVKPQILIPVHGEDRHLFEHARFGKTCGIPQTIVPHNGAVIVLAPGKPEIVDHVPVGVVGIDGKKIISMDSGIIHDRKKLSNAGVISAYIDVDKKGKLKHSPSIECLGIEDTDHDKELFIMNIRAEIEDNIKKLFDPKDIPAMKKDIMQLIRRHVFQVRGIKPLVIVHLTL